MAHHQRRDSVAVHVPHRLHHQIVWEVRDGAGIRHVHVPELFAVVEHGVHYVDAELELVDAATRVRGIELGLGTRGLFAIVRPVVGHARHDVLRARGGLGQQLGEDLFFVVIVLEVRARQCAHLTGELEHP